MTKDIWYKKNVESTGFEDYIYERYVSKDNTVDRVRVVKYPHHKYYSVFFSKFSFIGFKYGEKQYIETTNIDHIVYTLKDAIELYDLNNLKNKEIIHDINDLYD
jgi:hypothetical protein